MGNDTHAFALSNEELLSITYHEDELSEEKKEHLQHCALCQQRLAFYSQSNNAMLSKLYRSICPSAVDLNYYCLGIIPNEQRTNIAAHLLDCPLCADEVVQIRREQANFDPFPAAAPSLATKVRRIFATLVVQQAQPVLRASTTNAGWPRQYRAETIDLSLHLSHTSSGETMLLGIVTSVDSTRSLDAFEGSQVALFRAPGPSEQLDRSAMQTEPVLTTELDEVGNIFLEPVPPGDYIMVIQTQNQEIVIEDVHINLT